MPGLGDLTVAGCPLARAGDGVQAGGVVVPGDIPDIGDIHIVAGAIRAGGVRLLRLP